MRLTILIAVLIATPILSFAHHSTATNFTQEIITVEGVIEKVRFQNEQAY